jgi:7-keto-8-aminopelargonate synthetase-like enzyme
MSVLRGKVSDLTTTTSSAASDNKVIEFLNDFLATETYTSNTPAPIVAQLQQIASHLQSEQQQQQQQDK